MWTLSAVVFVEMLGGTCQGKCEDYIQHQCCNKLLSNSAWGDYCTWTSGVTRCSYFTDHLSKTLLSCILGRQFVSAGNLCKIFLCYRDDYQTRLSPGKMYNIWIFIRDTFYYCFYPLSHVVVPKVGGGTPLNVIEGRWDANSKMT